jgi:hypothetical protein
VFFKRLSIVKVTGWLAEELGFDSQQGQQIFLYSTLFRLALQPTQPIQWVAGPIS